MAKKQKRIFYRTNWQIQASPLRIIDSRGKQIGVFSLDEARRLAQRRGLDLVEIAPQAKPVVVKLVDYAKFKYQEAKKRQQAKKQQKQGRELKELRFSPFIDQGDLNNRLARARLFAQKGERLKIVVRFRGRQFSRQNFGYELIEKISQELAADYQLEEKPKIVGKRLIAFFKPKKRGNNHEETKKENA